MDLHQFFLQTISIFFMGLGFCMVFKIKGLNIILTSLGAMLGWAVYLLSSSAINSKYLSFLIAGFAISTYCEILARIRKAPVTVFLVISIFPLVPGANAYYTMEYCISKNFHLAGMQCVDMLGISASIAGGLFLSATIFKFIPHLNIMKKI